MEALNIYFRKDELVITPTKAPKPLSQVAENITVITAKEIEEMNAHTLIDVLKNITGIQTQSMANPGVAQAYIQGSFANHTRIIIDNVTMNDLSTYIGPPGIIPVQNIERIEIIKGPASSSYGSALGGVINVITKSGISPKAEGMLSGSYGESKTGDYRAEVSGISGPFEYYLYGGRLRTDGFQTYSQFDGNSFYTKLGYEPSGKIKLLFTLGYIRDVMGIGYPELDYKSDYTPRELFSTLSMNYRVTTNSDLDLSIWTRRYYAPVTSTQLSTGEELSTTYERDRVDGATIKFSLRQGPHTAVLGTDIEWDEYREPELNIARRKWAAFANDTIALGRFAVTPGIRYDYLDDNEDFLSPSLGITYKLTEGTMLRTYGARGFNVPGFSIKYSTDKMAIPNPDIKTEKVWSAQAGIESAEIKYLWLKAGFYYHYVYDGFDFETFPDGKFRLINKARQIIKGIELEMKTVPLYNTSLSAGATFINARDKDTGERIAFWANTTYDIGIQYKDKSFMAMLKGHYIKWNYLLMPLISGQEVDNQFIWDLNLSKKVYKGGSKSAEIFFTGHNIFDNDQYDYNYENYRAPRRWVEAGLRVRF